ncbi:MAG: flagellar FlbD family protein [Peptostreptococcaceae bacterium]|nr:flagellar FlbD family protein [Peptostreptococcaceae bacterium]
MVRLTSLKGEPFYLNAELIEKIEEIPDTLITLTSGKKIRVSQKALEVVESVIAYRRKINGGL